MGFAEYRQNRANERAARIAETRRERAGQVPPSEQPPLERIARDVATIRAIVVVWFIASVLLGLVALRALWG
jgi:hypothetical protein